MKTVFSVLVNNANFPFCLSNIQQHLIRVLDAFEAQKIKYLYISD